MNLRLSIAVTLACAMPLAACAAPEGYPSLAIRDSERISGSLDSPPAPIFTPSPAAPATLEQLANLTQAARSAHIGFLSAAQQARTEVNRAAGAPIGSVGWSAAQVAVAALETTRSQAVIALADIDSLYVRGALEGGELAELEAARSEVSGLVDEENRLIAALLSTLAS